MGFKYLLMMFYIIVVVVLAGGRGYGAVEGQQCHLVTVHAERQQGLAQQGVGMLALFRLMGQEHGFSVWN